MSTVEARPDDYLAFCRAVARLCGIDLTQYKRAQMERRIRGHARRRGADDLDGYLRLLRRDGAELDGFLDRITINVSELWRNPEQWAALGRDVVPELARAGRIRIWSAGCSNGAEAYTALAVCRDAAPDVGVEVRGTDVDRRVLEQARHGAYPATAARSAPRAALARHFEPTADGGWRAGPALRAGARFDQGDLLRMAVPRAAFDLVLCRNTVIYFTGPVRDALHARLATALRPGGHLLVGATERLADPAAAGVEPVAPFLYRRR
ncbi:CheR family methyltransferase [Patulibacter defluvii]|uniref:CheR family methyltransferase n=1 Tax=Patulibacter defluvii TaxID=3095358 RepID=UPI002A74D231|nr:protein-glutamate O-methyltransferase CheR [Patulibacter sp. DM4]